MWRKIHNKRRMMVRNYRTGVVVCLHLFRPPGPHIQRKRHLVSANETHRLVAEENVVTRTSRRMRKKAGNGATSF